MFYVLISIFIAWIWVDYFRLVDIYRVNKLIYLVIIFILGGLSTYLTGFIRDLFFTDFYLNGEVLNDALFSIFGIGAVEELAKLLPFILMYLFFSDEFKEPIDYLVYISVSALGFSAFENIGYFNRYGATIIDGRSILCSVGHMFDSALIAYGLIYCKFWLKKMNVGILLLFFFLASLSHGFYDFWLLNDVVEMGWLISYIYFLFTVSFFAVILNNALNISPYFTYKKVINSDKIAIRLLQYYGIVYVAQFLMVSYEISFKSAVTTAFFSVVLSGFVIVVTVARLSKFKLIKGRWEKIKVELPFTFVNQEINTLEGTFYRNRIVLKGESTKSSLMHQFYNEYIELAPSDANRSFIRKIRIAYVEDKVFLSNDEGYFVVKVFLGRLHGKHEYVLLKAKPMPPYHSPNGYILAGLFKIDNLEQYKTTTLNENSLRLLEWVAVRKRKG